MLESTHPLAELLRRDDRYRPEAYVFVFDALRFAQEKLQMGEAVDSNDFPFESDDELDDEIDSDDDFDFSDLDLDGEGDDFDDDSEPDRHVTGQELCEAMRRFALDQYGLLARNVFDHWGVTRTDDFGELVFNLIDIGQMKKTDADRREDFHNVYDFDEALCVEAVFSPTVINGDAAE